MTWFTSLRARLKSRSTVSIQKNLVNSVSLVVGTILFIVFLTVDLWLDGWVESQFEQSMINKANYLKSQVAIVDGQVVFDLDYDFLPQYQNQDDPHFFQFWRDGHSIQRSATLSAYPEQELMKEEIPLGTDKVVSVTMPNGNLGRALMSFFSPRSDTNTLIPLSLTIYESAQGLNRLLWIVDGLLIGCFLLAIVVMRFITVHLIQRGLQPLEQLNEDLKHFRQQEQGYQQAAQLADPVKAVEEIEPIRREINAFIQSNRALIQNEKRLSGDIAHELKTPLAEMIALSEVYLRFPQDERISKTYSQDMLNISKRMKKIVENLLLLQRTSSAALNVSIEPLAMCHLFAQVKQDLAFKYPDIEQRLQVQCEETEPCLADRFSLETILTNLIDNAMYYSPDGSEVEMQWERTAQGYQLAVTNHLNHGMTPTELQHLTRPLFQLDASRTSNERFGLGLSIIENLCHQNGYALQFTQSQPMALTVSIRIPKRMPEGLPLVSEV
ncbi:cell wall metabolism sensor histidine kinase WalK [Photobacterium sp. 1_MG-2023]|uniref:sensor histidine kinase n=1 Tax=Photobacterium sp. 1_MG-2023 TaxID=3062646 RepID=UPI0026E208E4|nr:HAMP domain-containing sensor histidine kinase [Photobacterium sp. 1_MG-2023]MDO6705087.1 HAMP domain-containing sensor histidine kinase [Photobacterium sp. 1_MG-2023]